MKTRNIKRITYIIITILILSIIVQLYWIINFTNQSLYKTEQQIKSSLSKSILIAYQEKSRNDLVIDRIHKNLIEQLSQRDIAINYNLQLGSKNYLHSDPNRSSNPKTIIYKYKNQEVVFTYSGAIQEVLHDYKTVYILTLSTIFLSIILTFFAYQIILKYSEFNQIKNEFISNITHELKTPLTITTAAIEGLSSFIEDGNREKTKKYLEISRNELYKLNNLVEQIVQISSLNQDKIKLKREEHDIIALLNQMVNSYAINTHKQITMDTSLTKFYKHIDKDHFQMAIFNLIDATIKYGGKTINVTVKNKENKLQLNISDCGVGSILSPIQNNNLNSEAYQLSNGYGLSLYYAKKIIEKHNGSLSYVFTNANKITIEL